MAKPWWTVFAVYADTEEGYVKHVQADDVAGAKAKAYREADSVILIAGVVAGKVYSEEEKAEVTPLRGRGHTIVVARIQVTERRVTLPSKCPKCKSDLRKPHAVRQIDYVARGWTGHLTKTGHDVSAERDQHVHDVHGGNAVIEAVKVRCAMCSVELWNGHIQEKT